MIFHLFIHIKGIAWGCRVDQIRIVLSRFHLKNYKRKFSLPDQCRKIKLLGFTIFSIVEAREQIFLFSTIFWDYVKR